MPIHAHGPSSARMVGVMSAVTTTAPAAPVPAPAPATGVPVLPPLRIGRHVIESPVVLAPMAGITNRAFRRLCREYGSAGLEAGGASGATSLYVNEMVTSRALVERNAETMRLISHGPEEQPRSVQLYSVDPVTAGLAARMLVTEDRADHIDLNFGCPVPKVTRKGGGAALPWKTELFRGIVRAVVREAGPYDVPVTVKMRIGIDDDHVTYLDAGRIAEAEGVAAVALHGRTASQAYSGTADWEAIARLKEAVTSVPVLGNGDIWSAEDALEMVRRTGCDGVVVGRGCLGRPWLFTDLAAAFAGSSARVQPGLREVTGHAASARRVPRRLLRRRREPRLPRHPQAHRLVPQGLPGGVDRAQPARPRRQPRVDRRARRDDGPRRPVAGRGRRGAARPRRVAPRRGAPRELAALARPRRRAGGRRRPGRAQRLRRLTSALAGSPGPYPRRAGSPALTVRGRVSGRLPQVRSRARPSRENTPTATHASATTTPPTAA